MLTTDNQSADKRGNYSVSANLPQFVSTVSGQLDQQECHQQLPPVVSGITINQQQMMQSDVIQQIQGNNIQSLRMQNQTSFTSDSHNKFASNSTRVRNINNFNQNLYSRMQSEQKKTQQPIVNRSVTIRNPSLSHANQSRCSSGKIGYEKRGPVPSNQRLNGAKATRIPLAPASQNLNNQINGLSLDGFGLQISSSKGQLQNENKHLPPIRRVNTNERSKAQIPIKPPSGIRANSLSTTGTSIGASNQSKGQYINSMRMSHSQNRQKMQPRTLQVNQNYGN